MTETESVEKAVNEGYFANNMTLREWFAGQALSGLLANVGCNHRPHLVAETAFAVADAMLKKSNLES